MSDDRFDHASMSLRGKIGAYAAHARHGGRAMTAKARKAAWERFLDQVDPNRELPEDERIKRAKSAQSAHMASIQYRSSQARKAKKRRAA